MRYFHKLLKKSTLLSVKGFTSVLYRRVDRSAYYTSDAVFSTLWRRLSNLNTLLP